MTENHFDFKITFRYSATINELISYSPFLANTKRRKYKKKKKLCLLIEPSFKKKMLEIFFFLNVLYYKKICLTLFSHVIYSLYYHTFLLKFHSYVNVESSNFLFILLHYTLMLFCPLIYSFVHTFILDLYRCQLWKSRRYQNIFSKKK